MAYTPRRTARYQYVWSLIGDIERRQCSSCIYRETYDPSTPMCEPRAGLAVAEKPVEGWRETANGVVVCDAHTHESTGRQPTDEPLPIEEMT